MAIRKVAVHPGEARTIANYLDERVQLLQMLTGAVSVICAREGISVASLSGVEGDSLVLEVPDDPDAKPDRTESPTTGAGVVGDISPASGAESAGNGQGSGNPDVLAPAVEAPDVGIPVKHPQFGGVQDFRHTEGG